MTAAIDAYRESPGALTCGDQIPEAVERLAATTLVLEVAASSVSGENRIACRR